MFSFYFICWHKSERIWKSSYIRFLFMDISSFLHLYLICIYCVFFSTLSKIMMTAQLQLQAIQPPEDNQHVQQENIRKCSRIHQNRRQNL